MITMHAHPRQTDARTNIMAIARRFVVTSASRTENLSSLHLRYETFRWSPFRSHRPRRNYSVLTPAVCFAILALYSMLPWKPQTCLLRRMTSLMLEYVLRIGPKSLYAARESLYRPMCFLSFRAKLK